MRWKKGHSREAGLDARKALVLAVIALLVSTAFAAEDTGAESWWNKLQDFLSSPARYYTESILGSIVAGLSYNPTLYCPPAPYAAPGCTVSTGMDLLISKWVRILIPFYAVAMLFTALFFLLKAGSPRGRARARSMFLKLLFGAVLVAFSPLIYQAMLDLSSILVNMFWKARPATLNFFLFTADVNLNLYGDMSTRVGYIVDRLAHSGLAFSCIIAYMAMFILMLSGLVLWLRNLMVFFYGVFFPVIIMFYIFEVTKPQGQKWLNQALKWIYVPPFQALILAFTILVAQGLEGITITGMTSYASIISNAITTMIILAGIFSFVLAPMIVGQVMSWMGDVVVAVGLGSGRVWMVTAGGIMAGHGGGALVSADTAFTRASALERLGTASTPSGESGPEGMGAMGSAGHGGYVAGQGHSTQETYGRGGETASGKAITGRGGGSGAASPGDILGGSGAVGLGGGDVSGGQTGDSSSGGGGSPAQSDGGGGGDTSSGTSGGGSKTSQVKNPLQYQDSASRIFAGLGGGGAGGFTPDDVKQEGNSMRGGGSKESWKQQHYNTPTGQTIESEQTIKQETDNKRETGIPIPEPENKLPQGDRMAGIYAGKGGSHDNKDGESIFQALQGERGASGKAENLKAEQDKKMLTKAEELKAKKEGELWEKRLRKEGEKEANRLKMEGEEEHQMLHDMGEKEEQEKRKREKR